MDGGPGLRAQLVHELPAQGVEHLERLGLAPGPVQGDHELAVQLLAQRVLGCQDAEFAQDLAMVAEVQTGVEGPLVHLEAQLIELVDAQRRPAPVAEPGQVGERRAAPQGQCRRALLADLVPVARPMGEAGGARPGLEHLDVQVPFGDEQLVAGRHGPQALAAGRGEDAAQPGRVVGEGRPGAGGKALVPHRVHERVLGHHAVRREKQRGQQDADLEPRDRPQCHPVVDHQGPEQPEPQHHVPHRRQRSASTWTRDRLGTW